MPNAKKDISRQTKIFLQNFQQFERILKETTGSSDSTEFRVALKMAATKNFYIRKSYFLIEDLYALRNVFSHRERGKYVASISDFALKNIDELIKTLNNPPTAISEFKTRVFQAKTEDLITSIVKEMRKKTYTHVPVWKDKVFTGVFSYTSFFEWLATRQEETSDEITFTKKIMGDINPKYLNSPSVNFQFIKGKMNIYEIPLLFDKMTQKKKRLDCLLITKNGVKNENITGIVTSWDLGAIK